MTLQSICYADLLTTAAVSFTQSLLTLNSDRADQTQMKKWLKSTVIATFFILGALGGLIIKTHYFLSLLFIFTGIIGTIYTYLSSENKQRNNEKFFDASAKLLFGAGIGNPYTRMIEDDLLKGGTYKRILDRLDYALEINPNDADALAWYVQIASLHISFFHLVHKHNSQPYLDRYMKVKQLIERGIKTGRHLPEFYIAKGMLLDEVSRYQEARRWYIKAGKLRTDPYWRMQVSTSYGMEGEYLKGLKEIEKAIQEGASTYIVDYYHGRALASVGEFDDALSKFQEAKKKRGYFYELTVSIQEAYYYKWNPIRSANVELLSVLYVFRRDRYAALKHLKHAIVHYCLPFFLGFLQVISRIAQHIPILRNSKIAKLCSPDQPEASLGMALVKQRRYLAAKKMFAIAAKRSVGVKSLLNLCVAAMLTADWEEAERACVTVLQREPSNELAKVYIERIKQKEASGQVKIVEAKDF